MKMMVIKMMPEVVSALSILHMLSIGTQSPSVLYNVCELIFRFNTHFGYEKGYYVPFLNFTSFPFSWLKFLSDIHYLFGV